MCGKIKGILLPRNYIKFPLVKVIVSKIAYDPRHTPNPCTLRTFCHQNITNKKLLTFSEKFYERSKIILQHPLKLFRTHYPLKKLSDFDLKDFENFYLGKSALFTNFPKSSNLICH